MRRLLHLSDVHFGPHHAPEAAAAALDLVARRRPDLVVVSGDLTQRAKPRQFVEARRFVDRIHALGVPSIAVPGNHDVPLYRVWERLFAPYGAYRRHFDRELEPTFADDELHVVGLNTAFNWTFKNGRLRLARLGTLGEQLAAVPATRCRIVVAHHPLVPAPGFGDRTVLRNALAATRRFAASGVEMVLSGHLHQAFVTGSDEWYPGSGERVLLVHSGTSSSYRGRGAERRRMTCNWIEVDAGEIRVTPLRYEPAGDAFAPLGELRAPRRAVPTPV